MLVAVVLSVATLFLMRENRLFRLEAAKPTFGFEFGLWPIDGIPVRWYLKNSVPIPTEKSGVLELGQFSFWLRRPYPQGQ